MPDKPVLQITCEPATRRRVGHPVPPGVLIDAIDMQLLRHLAARDVMVRVVCPGMRVFHAHVRALLQGAVPLPKLSLWYVSAAANGPLQPAPPPVEESDN